MGNGDQKLISYYDLMLMLTYTLQENDQLRVYANKLETRISELEGSVKEMRETLVSNCGESKAIVYNAQH